MLYIRIVIRMNFIRRGMIKYMILNQFGPKRNRTYPSPPFFKSQGNDMSQMRRLFKKFGDTSSTNAYWRRYCLLRVEIILHKISAVARLASEHKTPLHMSRLSQKIATYSQKNSQDCISKESKGSFTTPNCAKYFPTARADGQRGYDL